MTNHPNRKLVTIAIDGGFHGSAARNVRMPVRVYAMVLQGMSIRQALSAGQVKLLDKHFCGIAGCTCGGFDRAGWKVTSHRVVPV